MVNVFGYIFMGTYKDLTGFVFERLTVIKDHSRSKSKKIIWECDCSCGNKAYAQSQHLLDGRRVSCGCAKEKGKAIRPKNITTHGLSKTKTFKLWTGIKTRCLNKNVPNFKNYGGRGIKICERWLVFENFLKDMGEKPKGLSIDRIDNNGDYEPSNCRWATNSEQKRNTSRNTFLTHDGKTLTIAEWSDLIKINKHTISSRVRKLKWSHEKTLTTPPLTPSESNVEANKKRWGLV